MKSLIHKTAIAATLGALWMGSLSAQADTVLPPVQKNGNIEYLSGGIGLNESTAIKAASKQWPLTLEFAVKDKLHADYAANVNVLIRDAKKQARLQVKSTGPFLLVKMAPGKYMVDATLAGKTLHEQVVITSSQPEKLIFVWPNETGATRS
jgi:hypothetical protein